MLYEKPLAEGTQCDIAILKSAIKTAPQSLRPIYPAIKFSTEWVIAFVLLVLTTPLLVLMAVLTKLTSPGPALYHQVRLGKDGKPFTICKIRTMATDSEAKTGPVWAAADDKRVTPIGHFLRETHLDELPQLWNVLTGEMSLIGPRPERPELVARIERTIPNYRERLGVRPGLTGLAQVQLPADSDMDDVRRKLAYDLYYVHRLSFLLDARVALSTVFHLLGLCLGSCGKVLVRSYGRDVESDASVQPLFNPDNRRARSA